MASSRRTNLGDFSNVRAMATRCFSPPLNFKPRSPTTFDQNNKKEIKICSEITHNRKRKLLTRFISVRKTQNTVMNVSSSGGFINFLVTCIDSPILNIGPISFVHRGRLIFNKPSRLLLVHLLDGTVEQHRILWHNTNRLSHRRLLHTANILSIEKNCAILDIKEAEQKPYDG